MLEINYLAPVSNAVFSPTKSYILVFTQSNDRKSIVYSCLVKLKNVDSVTRAYAVNRSLNPLPTLLNAMLFEYDPISSQIKLLFKTHLSPQQPQIIMRGTPPITAKFYNQASYLEEQFYNFDEFPTESTCTMFMTYTPTSKLTQIAPAKCIISNPVYSRKDQLLVKEDKMSRKFKHLIAPVVDMYSNAELSSPSEIRVRGFNINPTLTFQFIGLSGLLTDVYGGSGFLGLITPEDDGNLLVPYSGRLVGAGEVDGGYYWKFASDYFIPEQVPERMYLPALYGGHVHPTAGVGAGSRDAREIIGTQPDTHLIYYIVIKGNNMKREKLEGWIDQGRQIASISSGKFIFLTNRPIEFSPDIAKWSASSIYTLVNTGEQIGYLR